MQIQVVHRVTLSWNFDIIWQGNESFNSLGAGLGLVFYSKCISCPDVPSAQIMPPLFWWWVTWCTSRKFEVENETSNAHKLILIISAAPPFRATPNITSRLESRPVWACWSNTHSLDGTYKVSWKWIYILYTLNSYGVPNGTKFYLGSQELSYNLQITTSLSLFRMSYLHITIVSSVISVQPPFYR